MLFHNEVLGLSFFWEKGKKNSARWAWWHRPVFPTFGQWRQEDLEFKVSLGYIVRPVSKNKNKTKTSKNNVGLQIL
jgi:hypothetical protein